LSPLQGEAGVSAEDDIDSVRRVLEPISLLLIPILLVLALLLHVLVEGWGIQVLPEVVVLSRQVLGLWAPWALLVQQLLKLLLRGS
jgi:hypothetical protein